jgi:hypothetical protein
MVGIRTTNRDNTTEAPRRNCKMDQTPPSDHDPLTQRRKPKALVHIRENCRPARRHPEKGNPPPIPRPGNQGTPRARPHHCDHLLILLMAEHERVDRTIHEGMHQMPTRQEPHETSKSTPLPNPYTNRCTPISDRGNGPNHPTPNQQWV